MRKFLASALAVLTLAGSMAAVASPANAGGRRHHHHHRGGGNDVAVAAIAGIAGLALGAAIADNDRGRYYGGRTYYRGSGYRYDPRYDSYYGGYYARGPRVCVTRERVWDPYIRRYVRVQREYRC